MIIWLPVTDVEVTRGTRGPPPTPPKDRDLSDHEAESETAVSCSFLSHCYQVTDNLHESRFYYLNKIFVQSIFSWSMAIMLNHHA